MHCLWKVITVLPDQSNGGLDGLKHGISGVYAVPHSHQVSHDGYQNVIVSVAQILSHSNFRLFYELVQLSEAKGKERES